MGPLSVAARCAVAGGTSTGSATSTTAGPGRPWAPIMAANPRNSSVADVADAGDPVGVLDHGEVAHEPVRQALVDQLGLIAGMQS